MDIEITEKGKMIKKFGDVAEKKFKSGKEGYYAGGTCVINGSAYRINILLYKVA